MIVYEWDEDKRERNLAKHVLDFIDAKLIYECEDKITLSCVVNGEMRHMDLAPLHGRLAALIYTMRGEKVRIISYRIAKRPEETDIYEQHKRRQPS